MIKIENKFVNIEKKSVCHHCGLNSDQETPYTLKKNSLVLLYCCLGCLSASKTIYALGLSDYYRYRDIKQAQPVSGYTLTHPLKESLMRYDHPEEQRWITQSTSTNTQTVTLILQGVQCAACCWLIESRLKQLKGIISVKINHSLKRAFIEWNQQTLLLSTVLWCVYEVGYSATPFRLDENSKIREIENKASLKRVWIASLGMMQVMMFAVGLYFGAFEGIEAEYSIFFKWISLFLTFPITLYCGAPIFIATWHQIKNKQVTMNFTISLAIILALSASILATIQNKGDVYYDSVTMFIFFITLTRYLEKRLHNRAIESYEQLGDSFPKIINRVTLTGQETIPLHSANTGDIIRIKPGEMIPIDGVVTQGSSNVVTAVITGEFSAQHVKINDLVFAGSQNYDSSIDIKIEKLGSETRYAHILKILSQAMSEKPNNILWVDLIAKKFVFGILIFSLLTYVIWLFFNPDKAFFSMLAVLVASCPCALSIATPTALTASGFSLSQKGFLITKGHVLELLTKIDTAIFDKTGTLTFGVFKIINYHLFDKIFNYQSAYNLAASLEQYSEHPIANAFKEVPQIWHIFNSVQNHVHQGIEGKINSDIYKIGSLSFVSENKKIEKSANFKLAIDWENLNTINIMHTQKIIYLSKNNLLIAAFILEDTPRLHAKEFILSLKKRGISTYLFSGDNKENADNIGKKIGIEAIFSELNPEEKLQLLSKLKK